jgi:hypothetical protein
MMRFRKIFVSQRQLRIRLNNAVQRVVVREEEHFHFPVFDQDVDDQDSFDYGSDADGEAEGE